MIPRNRKTAAISMPFQHFRHFQQKTTQRAVASPTRTTGHSTPRTTVWRFPIVSSGASHDRLDHSPRSRAGSLDQRRDPTQFGVAEIPTPLIWQRLERCRATHNHSVDAVQVVSVFGCVKWSVLRPQGHQTVRRRSAFRLWRTEAAH